MEIRARRGESRNLSRVVGGSQRLFRRDQGHCDLCFTMFPDVC